MRKSETRINNIAVVSDLHCGCAMGLIHKDGVQLDDGGHYTPSVFQQKLYAWWCEFWEWIEEKTHDEEIDVVINGDIFQGKPHGAIHQVSDNLDVQERIALDLLRPIAAKARKLYVIRGTEAHNGKSDEYEERIARQLGAVPSATGQYARYDLWKLIGRSKEGILCNFMHHIGTTGTSHYESTAVLKELVEAYVQAGRWNDRAPDCVVRSHRHTCIQVQMPASPPQCWATSITTPAWQGKTPFASRIPGARQAQPQIGGVLIREAPDGVWYATPWARTFTRAKPEE